MAHAFAVLSVAAQQPPGQGGRGGELIATVLAFLHSFDIKSRDPARMRPRTS